MTREDVVIALCEYFNLDEPEFHDGKHDLDDYDWRAGCSMGLGSPWLTLANVVEALEPLCED